MILLRCFQLNAPCRIAFNNSIVDVADGHKDGVTGNIHGVGGAGVVVRRRSFLHTDVIERAPVASVHGVVLPHHVLGPGIAAEGLQPRRVEAVVDAMPHAFLQCNAMGEQ